MRWFLNLTTRAKLIFSFGLVIVLFGGVVISSYKSITRIIGFEKTLYEKDFADAVDLTKFIRDQNSIRVNALYMMLVTTGPEYEQFDEKIKTYTQHNEEVIGSLINRASSDSETLGKLQEVKALFETFGRTLSTEVIPLIQQVKMEEAKTLVLGPQYERHQKIKSISEELEDEAIARAQNRMISSRKIAEDAIRLLFIAGLIVIFLSVLLVVILNRILANPLRIISGIAERVASGDLTVSVPSDHRRDEVGILAQTFRKMVENLRRVTGELLEGVNVLGSAASEILAGTTQVAAGASETATAVSQTTATVEEVRQTVQVASHKAKYVSDSAQKATQTSQSGKKSVEDSIQGMNRIREQTESIADSIVRLSEQSQAIGEIIATVNDLAEQSNLLAVNAAIEAAKAGEQGKGFAVVAQEIKSLAEQSKQATTQVRTILNDIQKATSAAVMATEQGSKAVEAGMRQSTEAGEAIRVLTDGVAEAAQAATQIAASSQQQLVGMDQVALAMESIKQASSQNVAGTKQTETAAHNLSELGQKLKQIVQQFKIG